MMEEIWKDIDGYEEHYQVSSIGRIRSVEAYDAYKKAMEYHGIKNKYSIV